jgi:hypothetical protein
LAGLETAVDNTTQRISLAKNSLVTLRDQAELLRNEAGDLKSKATKLQEANVEGWCRALNVQCLTNLTQGGPVVKVQSTKIRAERRGSEPSSVRQFLVRIGEEAGRLSTAVL